MIWKEHLKTISKREEVMTEEKYLEVTATAWLVVVWLLLVIENLGRKHNGDDSDVR